MNVFKKHTLEMILKKNNLKFVLYFDLKKKYTLLLFKKLKAETIFREAKSLEDK